jgi:hypothetical protein
MYITVIILKKYKAMETKDLQKKVDETFKENFGYTPDTERTNDITREFFELMRATDEENKQEETGDLLCSLIESCTEKGWEITELRSKNWREIL